MIETYLTESGSLYEVDRRTMRVRSTSTNSERATEEWRPCLDVSRVEEAGERLVIFWRPEDYPAEKKPATITSRVVVIGWRAR